MKPILSDKKFILFNKKPILPNIDRILSNKKPILLQSMLLNIKLILSKRQFYPI